jgi:hypothetical protein
MNLLGRRGVVTGSIGGSLLLSQHATAQQPAGPSPVLPTAEFAAARRAISQRFPILIELEQSAESIIRSAFSSVDVTPPWTPNDVYRLAEDVSERMSEILSLRQQLIDLEMQAFESTSFILVEEVRLQSEKDAFLRNVVETLLQKAIDSAGAEEAGYGAADPLAAGFRSQAAGRLESALLARADWVNHGKKEADALLAAQIQRLDRMKAALLDPLSPMNFKARHAKLANVLRDAGAECLAKAACLKAGLKQHFFGFESTSEFPSISDDDLIEKLTIWIRSVGRYLESLFSNRYTVRFGISLTRPQSFGNPPLTRYTAGNIGGLRGFQLEEAHFNGLQDPLIRGIAVQYVSNSWRTFVDEGYRRAIRINTILSIPEQQWAQPNPLAMGSISWRTGGNFRFDGTKVFDGEEPDIVFHPRFQNISPVGSWAIQILPNAIASFAFPPGADPTPDFDPKLDAWVSDIRLLLDLSVKAPSGT